MTRNPHVIAGSTARSALSHEPAVAPSTTTASPASGTSASAAAAGAAEAARSRLGGRRATRPGLILAIVLVSQLMVVLDASIVNIALPDIGADLGLSPTGLSWVINAYTLTFGGLLLLGARAGDILGRRRVFAAGIALFSVASLAGGFATTSTELLIARAIQGVGAAIAAPSSLAILMTLFPKTRERTRALGWFAAVSVGGAAIGLIAGGMLTQWASWRWVMFVNVPIGIALLVAIVLALPETARNPGHVDVAGALTSTLGVGAMVYGLVRAASTSWTDVQTVVSLVAAVILLVAFVLDRGAGGVAHHPAAAVRQPKPERIAPGPVADGGRDVRDVLLPDPVRPGDLRLLTAQDRHGVPATARSRCSSPRRSPHGYWRSGSPAGH